MYVYNILTDWKQFYKEGNLDEYIIELLDQYQSLGPLPGIFLPFIESFFSVLTFICICFCKCCGIWSITRVYFFRGLDLFLGILPFL